MNHIFKRIKNNLLCTLPYSTAAMSGGSGGHGNTVTTWERAGVEAGHGSDVVRRELRSCALAWKVVVKGPWWGRGGRERKLLEAGGRNHQVDWPGKTGGRWPMHQTQWAGRPPGDDGRTDGKMESLWQQDAGHGSDPPSQIWDPAASISRSPASQTNALVRCTAVKPSPVWACCRVTFYQSLGR